MNMQGKFLTYSLVLRFKLHSLFDTRSKNLNSTAVIFAFGGDMLIEGGLKQWHILRYNKSTLQRALGWMAECLKAQDKKTEKNEIKGYWRVHEFPQTERICSRFLSTLDADRFWFKQWLLNHHCWKLVS